VLSIDGKPAVLGVCIDVSELVEANEQLERLYRSLRHDIISSIKGVVDSVELLAMSGFAPGPEYEGIYNLLRNKAEIAYQLTSSTGKLGEPLKTERVSIGEIFDMAKATFNAENVRVEYPKEDITIDVDPNAFFLRVLNNLITNAIRYSPPQSEVILGVKNSEQNIVIFVQDYGSGLSKSEIEVVMNNYGASARLNGDIPVTGTG
jgi:K+-sensing histidine kinase KdpD